MHDLSGIYPATIDSAVAGAAAMTASVQSYGQIPPREYDFHAVHDDFAGIPNVAKWLFNLF